MAVHNLGLQKRQGKLPWIKIRPPLCWVVYQNECGILLRKLINGEGSWCKACNLQSCNWQMQWKRFVTHVRHFAAGQLWRCLEVYVVPRAQVTCVLKAGLVPQSILVWRSRWCVCVRKVLSNNLSKTLKLVPNWHLPAERLAQPALTPQYSRHSKDYLGTWPCLIEKHLEWRISWICTADLQAHSYLLLEILSCQTANWNSTAKLPASTNAWEHEAFIQKQKIESDMLWCDWAVHTTSHRFAQNTNRICIMYWFTHQTELNDYSDIIVFHYVSLWFYILYSNTRIQQCNAYIQHWRHFWVIESVTLNLIL